MKKFILFITLLAVTVSLASAQHKKGDRTAMRQEVHEYKLKYLAQEMELTPEQEKSFVEVYNQMWDEKSRLYKEKKENERKLKNAKNVSDAEYTAANKAMSDIKGREAAIDKKYEAQFAKFLSPKQIYKMREAEDKFRAKMREMRHQRKNKPARKK